MRPHCKKVKSVIFLFKTLLGKTWKYISSPQPKMFSIRSLSLYSGYSGLHIWYGKSFKDISNVTSNELG